MRVHALTTDHGHVPPPPPGRLAQRWGLTNGKNVEQTEADLKALFPEELWRDAHLQVRLQGPHTPNIYILAYSNSN